MFADLDFKDRSPDELSLFFFLENFEIWALDTLLKNNSDELLAIELCSSTCQKENSANNEVGNIKYITSNSRGHL